MTLKKELEILSGEPIEVFDGDPMDIPCIETSDSEKLCKNPVVSVHMVTYNHEPYIRQAIEGVLMQQTDFEFELVIGEDCSTDRTREICFEYQKKHPDKVRVLWWHENVSKLGGNSRRVRARCRGDYIAFCERDDYWTDDKKLRGQVALMRKQDAGLCVGKVVKLFPDGHMEPDAFSAPEVLNVDYLGRQYFHTSTIVVKRDVFENASLQYRRMKCRWWDVTMVFCIASLSTPVFLDNFLSVRRITGIGIASSLTARQLCCLELRQYLPLYRFGPRGKMRRIFANRILSTTRQLMLFTDDKSMKWLQTRRWLLSRLFFEISVHEMLVCVYAGMRNVVQFSRIALPVLCGHPPMHGRVDSARKF